MRQLFLLGLLLCVPALKHVSGWGPRPLRVALDGGPPLFRVPPLATQEHLGERCYFDSGRGLRWTAVSDRLVHQRVGQKTHGPSMNSRCLTQAGRAELTVLEETGKGEALLGCCYLDFFVLFCF